MRARRPAARRRRPPYGFSAHRPPGPPRRAGRGRWASACSTTSRSRRATRSTRHGLERVMILDWDVHHGNGTNDIFHAEPRVLFVSIHQSPLYPGTGPASATSAPGRGVGLHGQPAGAAGLRRRRLPRRWSTHVVVPLARVVRAAAGAGLGRLRRPPRGSAGRLPGDRGGLRGDGALASRRVAVELGVPVGCVLEGGYALGALARSVAATMEALRRAACSRSVGDGARRRLAPGATAAIGRLREWWPDLA